jgi:cobaltochelatase CobN
MGTIGGGAAAQLATSRRTLGQILICVGCCCGRPDKGKPAVPLDRLKGEWKRRKLLPAIQLTISGCLGPCDLVNVACVVGPQGLTWLGGLTRAEEYETLLEWAARSAEARRLLPLPDPLAAHVFTHRFLAQEAPAANGSGFPCEDAP